VAGGQLQRGQTGATRFCKVHIRAFCL